MRLTAWNADQWMACPGSVRVQSEFPPLSREPSQAALEGRACHEVAQKLFAVFSGGTDPLTLTGTLSKDGIVITQELYDAAREYVNDVIGIANQHQHIQHLHIEQPLQCDDLQQGMKVIPDAWLYVPQTNTLYVWDAKFGHRLVEPTSWQLFVYVIALLSRESIASGRNDLLGIDNNTLQSMQIVLTIAQPRGYSPQGTIRRHTLGFIQLITQREQLETGARLALSDNAPCITGSQCDFCSGRAHCQTLQNESYRMTDIIKSINTHDLDHHALGVEIKLLRHAESLLKARLSGLEEQALHHIRQGNNVSFFTAKQGYGRETWRSDTPIEQIIMMGDLMGVDIRKPVELDTPAQARKKGIDESVIAEYSEKCPTALKLVEADTAETIKQVFERGNAQ